MVTELIQYIPLDDIQPNPNNRRIGGFDQKQLEELADSIRAVGVLEPAIVRQNGQEQKYELVAGERRWRACKIAGELQLPCVVRELSDMQVLKVQTIENLQRKNIHPLDEAEGYATLIQKADYDVEVLAKQVGRSISYVYQRLKLRDLIEPAREALAKNEITAGHAILIARLAPKQQEKALEYCSPDYEGERMSVRQLDQMIHTTILMDLSKASFKMDDALLFPEAGACQLCPKRTGYAPELFPDIAKDDCCTDPECFNAKLDAMVTKKRKELAAAGIEFLEVVGAYEFCPPGALDYYEWRECRKKDEGAVRCLIVTGPDRGRVTWGVGRKRLPYEASPEEKAGRKKQKEEQKLTSEIRTRLWNMTTAAISADIEENGFEENYLHLVARTFLNEVWFEYRKKLCKLEGLGQQPKGDRTQPDWNEVANSHLRSLSGADLQVFMVKSALVKSFDGPTSWAYEQRDELAEMGQTLGIDFEAIEAEVRKEHAEKMAKREARAGAKK